MQGAKPEEVRYFDAIMHLSCVIDAQQFGAAEKSRRHVKRFRPMRNDEINCHQQIRGTRALRPEHVFQHSFECVACLDAAVRPCFECH